MRSYVYCLIPAALAPKLHRLLRDHYRGDPSVEVVVERRRGERRVGEGRRHEVTNAPEEERRRIRNVGGRRVGDRRAAQVTLTAESAPELPRRARRYAGQVSFIERLEPSTEAAEDADTARLVTRIQAGESEEFTILYQRYFDRVYGYLRVALRNADDAEELTQQAFAAVFENLPRYERREKPFRSWLFAIVRNLAVSALRAQARVEPVDPAEIANHREAEAEPEELRALSWVSNRELLVLIERLPAPQRQVLTLRFMFGMPIAEIAQLLETTPNHASVLQYRALGFLRKRLAAAGREGTSKTGRRARTQRCIRQARVLRNRRFVLSP